MKPIHIFAVAFLVTVIYVESGIGIKCFECTSFHRPDCGDHFDNTPHNPVDCGGEKDRCRKIVQQIKIGDEWEVRYLRQCAASGVIGNYEGRECNKRIDTNGTKMMYCHCNNMDGCNDASSWNIPVVLMATAFVGQYIWKRLFSFSFSLLLKETHKFSDQ